MIITSLVVVARSLFHVFRHEQSSINFLPSKNEVQISSKISDLSSASEQTRSIKIEHVLIGFTQQTIVRTQDA